MNRIESNHSLRPWSRPVRISLFLLPALLVLLISSSAKASCLASAKAAPNSKASVVMLQPAQPANDGEDFGFPTVVGLWHVHYTQADGTPFNETFKTWHADRTEWEQAIGVPGGGYCYGVWKEIGPRTVKLHHLGFIFGPDGSLAANFILDETDTVDFDNHSYSGHFDFKQYDSTTGALMVEIKGSVAATRITVD
jgi:hypothetical protein